MSKRIVLMVFFVAVSAVGAAAQAATALPAGQWSHLAATLTSTKARLWINGKAAAEVWTPDGRLYNLARTAITQHPGMKLGVGQPLFDAGRFAGVTLHTDTRQLLASNPQGAELQRLNRLLLDDAFPQEISGGMSALEGLDLGFGAPAGESPAGPLAGSGAGLTGPPGPAGPTRELALPTSAPARCPPARRRPRR